MRQFGFFIRSFVGSYHRAGQRQLPTKPASGLVAVITQHGVIPLKRVVGYYELLKSASKPEVYCSREGTTLQDRTVHFSLPFLPGLSKAFSTPSQASPSLAQKLSRVELVAVVSKGGDLKAPISLLLAGQEQPRLRPSLPSSAFPYCCSSGEHSGGLSRSRSCEPPAQAAGTRQPGMSLSPGVLPLLSLPICQVALELLRQAPL